MEFPEMIFATLDEDSHDVNAYVKQFAAVNDDGKWDNVGVYKLVEVRRLRKITEQKEAAKKP